VRGGRGRGLVSGGGAERGSPGEALQRLRDIEPEPKWLILMGGLRCSSSQSQTTRVWVTT